ncbi:MAG: metal-dependent hydrolase [Actinophytocola sp.]|uniref:endonuclease/exonuclease/phosphatase family protein n=1 Tax=Actinophytocola sp. TaxID=1872138 RepID=UPI001324BC59|nr:endonuclease/exonuclease/phosphatase family protein [Actinophytocola sp.]MPZ83809.1 metal-dependent hydrolase [Actinophytocola sp.]
MRRTHLVPLLALLTVVGLATPAAADQRAPSVRPLTVLSFNIHHAAGLDGVFDLDRLTTEIRHTRADVIGLQEVDRNYGERSGWTDEPAELARRLGMHVVYGANLDLEPPAPGRPRRQYGTAILSRYPILEWHNTLLPKARPEEEQRGLLEAVLNVRGLDVRAMTTHFQHDNAEARVLQANAVAAAVRSAAEPVVLTGDLNATPDTPEVRTLTAILADSHAEAGRGDGFTYPAEAPAARIDYVLTDALPVVSTVRPTEASDHRPTIAGLVVWGPRY